MTIGIGCDHGGFELKEELVKRLRTEGNVVVDKGCFSMDEVDYPDMAEAVAA